MRRKGGRGWVGEIIIWKYETLVGRALKVRLTRAGWTLRWDEFCLFEEYGSCFGWPGR